MNSHDVGALRILESAMDARLTEDDVRTAARFLGYDLVKFPGGYQLERDDEREREIIIASTLELIPIFSNTEELQMPMCWYPRRGDVD
jgi:hypothetical protein